MATAPLNSIDFNCDLGEGCGNDAAILPFISSASLACGLHAGSSLTLRDSIGHCLAAGVCIGAHPSFDDRAHFGRRDLDLAPADVYALTLYQVGAAAAMVRALGGRLAHVKPHGALYNRAASHLPTARALANAVRDVDSELLLFGLAESESTRAGEAIGLSVVHEVFAERRYEADGRLTPRARGDAVLSSVEESLDQVRQLVQSQTVTARTGETVALRVDSLCLHGDRDDAVEFARSVRATLDELGVAVRAPQRRAS